MSSPINSAVAAPPDNGALQTAPLTRAYSGPRKIFLLITLLLSWMLANADRVAMSVSIVPITKEFKLGPEAAGLVLSAFYISYSLMQLGAGWLADRFGSRKILVFCVACWSIFTALTGFAGSLAALVVIRILFGIGEGGFAPASSVTVAEAFPRQERARAKSLVIGASFLGGAIGSGAIAALIATHGWRYAYHAFGLFGVVMATVLWFAVRESPARSRSVRESGLFRTLLRSPVLRRTMLIYFFGNVVQIGLSSWMPTFLMSTRNIDILHAGVASAIPFLVAFATLNLVGWLLDRFGDGREHVFLAVGSAMMIGFLGLMAFADSLSVLLSLWTLSLVGYTVIYGTVFAIPLKHLPDQSIGTAVGIINFGGQIASGLGPLVIGFLVAMAHGGFVPAFAFLLLAGAGALIVALTWRRT
jgi:ACS family hexuronate transporter-like MFS transporter